jgi:hypothetical protein
VRQLAHRSVRTSKSKPAIRHSRPDFRARSPAAAISRSSCMPYSTIPSEEVALGPVTADQAGCGVWERLARSGVAWGRCHYLCHFPPGLPDQREDPTIATHTHFRNSPQAQARLLLLLFQGAARSLMSRSSGCVTRVSGVGAGYKRLGAPSARGADGAPWGQLTYQDRK